MAATYDSTTALVVVDVQNDFADPHGSLSVAGADDVIEACNHEIDVATSCGAFIVYTQDWHPPDTPHFEKDGGVWPVHCVRDTWGAELHPDLTVAGLSVRKGTGGEDGYSGFTMRDPVNGETASTGLQETLSEHRRRTHRRRGSGPRLLRESDGARWRRARLRHHHRARRHGSGRSQRRRRCRRRERAHRRRRPHPSVITIPQRPDS